LHLGRSQKPYTLKGLPAFHTRRKLPSFSRFHPSFPPHFVPISQRRRLPSLLPTTHPHTGRCQTTLVKASLEDAAPSFLDHASALLTTKVFFLADAAATATGIDTDAVAAAADTASKKSSWTSFFSDPLEAFLKQIDNVLDAAHVPYSYGFSIIILTILVKVATYPLSAKQVQSTLALQALQPQVKELQAKYANDTEKLQLETARLYQTNQVNPLAGCLPTLVTIPVFIGLYRALSNVADEGLLTEGFFWIPSLAGPTKLNGGLGWLNPGSDDFLGWAQTIAYLVMPVLLVISQSLSTKVLSPAQQSTDPSQQQTQAILKFLPLMIGYFSLNVPSGLTLYWLTNNFVTTAQQLYLRRKFDAGNVVSASDRVGGGSSSTLMNSPTTEVNDRPSGKDMNARRPSKTIDIEATTVETSSSSPSSAPSSTSSPSRGSRGQKFRSIKAREAAARASSQASSTSSSNGSAAQKESDSNANGTVSSADRPGVPDAPPAKDSRGKGKKKK